jgi:phosphoribosyl-ATP pyrophosphohydrolase/phosphoribosyl-AMP cyclohydrolase
MNVDELEWDKGDGLLPAIVQDAVTRQVLMLGFMNREALETTLATKQVTFFSRTKQRLWTKGETSGHTLELVEAYPDCDRDTVLCLVHPAGPTCHRNTTACFDEPDAPGLGFLGHLWRVIDGRARSRPPGSYTTELFEAGVRRAAQKVGEEAVEVALAETEGELLDESADLIYHLWVLLRARGVTPEEVAAVLRQRHAGG